tara:strand:+ start:2494 stop:2667 length:174 start_codon:yes stop_codon:yes gene_type:complete
MKNFNIEITETLQRQIEVSAKDQDDAIDQVRKMYSNEEIVLDSEDFMDFDIECIKED